MEDLFQYLGEWGVYHTRLFLLLVIPVICKGMQTMVAVIIFHVPEHRCRMSGWAGDTYRLQSEEHREAVNRTIPLEGGHSPSYSHCTTRNTSSADNSSQHGAHLAACHAWVYDTSEVDTSLITEFDLVCDRKTYRAHLNMSFLVGSFLGTIVSGYLCDRFGRKTVFCVSNLAIVVITVLSSFPPTVEVFLVYRFISGVLGSAVYMSGFVLVMEMVGPTKRTRAASVMTIAWLTGPFLTNVLSFVVRQWRYLNLISAAPLVLCLGHWWLLPESPRWLLIKNKTEPAMKVIRKVARVNKIAFSASANTIVKLQEKAESSGNGKRIFPTILQLMKNPTMVLVSIIIFFNWCIVSMTYYGLSLNVGNLAGSLRLNFFVSTAVELVGYSLAWLLLDRLGRKRSHCAFMLTAGLACLATILTVSFGGKELQWMTTALAMVGKLGVSASFTAVYLISAEVFPTVVRNFGMSCSSIWGRIGSIVSPYVADLALHIGGDFGLAVPLVIFGGLAVVAGILALYLPETLHRTLPDTVEDAVNFVKNRGERPEKEKEEEEKQAGEMIPLSNTTIAL